MRSGASDSSSSSSYRGSLRSGQIRNPRVFVFTINILKVTRIPSPMRLSFTGSSSLRIPSKRTLKITVLHGSKQKEIGEFDIVQDECLINQRISCRLFCGREDDLGKLHIYIDQAHSSGLAGHVALDLKEFLEDLDSEVYIKYPLSASSPRDGYVPKLKVLASLRSMCASLIWGSCVQMTLECTCLGNPENLFIPDLDAIIHHKPSVGSAVQTKFVPDGTDSEALSLFRNDEAEGGGEHCPEMHLLEELETVLLKLDNKLKYFVATCKPDEEKDIPVDSSTVMTKVVMEQTGDNREDCSDCAVCSKGLLDKFEGISSSIGCSTVQQDDGSNCLSKDVEQQRKMMEETKQRSNVFKHIVGGVLLVGLSVFAVKTVNKNERPQLWPWRRREKD